MRKFYLFFVLLFSFSSIFGQNNFSVTSFRLDETDMTANTAGTIILDQNGEKCALIKIETTQTGFSFDAGMLGITKIVQKTGEIWLYLPQGVKRLTISHQQLGVIRDYDLGTSVQAGKAYIMSLAAANVMTIVEDQVTRQWLVFEVKPSNAIVFLNGEPLHNEGGVFMKYLNFGDYDYSIQAADYHTLNGVVTINNPDNKHKLSIELQPAFGYLSVPSSGTLSGATVSVDNSIIGTTPIASKQLSSGQHTVLITRPKYKSYTGSITIEDGQIFTLEPPLQANFSQVTITGVEGGEIWINGNFVGYSPWTGDLEYGPYQIECRMQNHRTTIKSFDFYAGASTAIALSEPTPIYGSLNISSSPAIVNVAIDGNPYGETPLAINRLLVGPHEIRLSKSGFADFIQTVTISEGKLETLNATLSSTVPVTLSTNVKNPKIVLDNQSISSLSSVKSLAIGEHTISITANDYDPFTQTFIVSQDGVNRFSFSPELSFVNRTYSVKGVLFKMIAVQGGSYDGIVLSSFYVGETEVTQELWDAVMYNNPSRLPNPNHPVTNVSWSDCQTFLNELNSLTGKKFRLLTESEWEYAASGGNKTRGYKFSGSNNIDEVAWYDNNSSGVSCVKQKAPNELGIYDMSGNVWEWCSDWYSAHTSKGVNPTGPTEGKKRVKRGGGYNTNKAGCKTKFRGISAPKFGDIEAILSDLLEPDYSTYSYPSVSGFDIGLRLAL